MLQVFFVFPLILARTILVSWASDHMCYSLHMFSNIRPGSSAHHTITIPNGTRINVSRIGDIQLTPTILITNVLFVSQFRFNLISVHRLCHDTSSTILLIKIVGCWVP